MANGIQVVKADDTKAVTPKVVKTVYRDEKGERKIFLRGMIGEYRKTAESNLYGTRASEKKLRDETIYLMKKDADEAVKKYKKALAENEIRKAEMHSEKQTNLTDAINLCYEDYRERHSPGRLVRGAIQKSDAATWALLK